MILRFLAILGLFCSPAVFAQFLDTGKDGQYVTQFSIVADSGHSPDNAPAFIAKVETSASAFALELNPIDLIGSAEWDGESDISFYSGHLIDDEKSWARVTVSNDLFYGLVKYNGRYITLSNYPGGGTELPNPFRGFSNRVAQAYLPFEGFNGDPEPEGASFSRVLPIGVVVDHFYNERFNGAGVAHALAIVNATDGIFRENLQFALKIEAVLETTDEDFSLAEGATTEQLVRFSSFRREVSELAPELGVVHLFSNSPRTGTVIGRAYISTACTTYGLDIGVSVPYSDSLSSQLMAHELGHNLGARHDTDVGCEDGPRKIMYPYINASREFSSCSLDRIRAKASADDCYLNVAELSIALRGVDNTLVLQVSNNSEFVSNDVSVTLDRTDNLTSDLPEICRIEADQIVCDIPQLNEGETLDLSFAVSGSPQGLVAATVQAENIYETDRSDNTAVLDLADFSDDTDGLCIDTDGDGHGWNGTRSCRTRVTPRDDSEERPEYINVQTGIPVNLVQAFWKPAEFTGQVIECIPHYWSSDDRFYKKDDSLIRRYRHELAEGQDASGSVQVATFARSSENGDIVGTTVEETTWSIEDGRYTGPAPVTRSSYIQIVDEAGTRFNATRSWTSNISFDLCTSFPDTSGYFIPSGTIDRRVPGACIDTPPRNDGFGWNGVESCKVDPDRDVTGSRSLIIKSKSAGADVVIDGILDELAWADATTLDTSGVALRTGTTIFGLDSVRSATWLATHDDENLYLAIVAPDETPVNDSDVLYQDDSIELFFDAGYQRNTRYDSDDTQVILRENGERTGVTPRAIDVSYVRSYDEEEQQYIYEIRLSKSSLKLTNGEFGIEVQVNDDQDGELRDSKWGWSAETGIDSTWYDMTLIGHACFDNGGVTENCLLGSGPKDDCVDTEPLGDGWGWDGTDSCRIVCVDTDPVGDGWGWNGFESCRVQDLPKDCVDTDPVGDGWGWDGTDSCRIDPGPGACIDTEPMGDGWGWNGTESCRITCVDTPPVGDGWGWDGSGSCRVGGTPMQCIDTPPVGDGWGWNGVRSCRITE